MRVRAENGKMVEIDDAPVRELSYLDALDYTPQGFAKKKVLNMGKGLFGIVTKATKKKKIVPELSLPKGGTLAKSSKGGGIVPPSRTGLPAPVGGERGLPVPANKRRVIDMGEIPNKPSGMERPALGGGNKALGYTQPSSGGGAGGKPPSAGGSQAPSSGGKGGVLGFIKKNMPSKKTLGMVALTGAAGYAYDKLTEDDPAATPVDTSLRVGDTAPSSVPDRAYMHLVPGTKDQYVDDSGNIQSFEVNDPSKNAAMRKRLADEQARFGDIAGANNIEAKLPKDSGGVNGGGYYDDSARQAAIARGLELLDKANSVSQVNAVATLLNSAGIGRVPQGNVESAYDSIIKQQRIALNNRKLSDKPKDPYGYDNIIAEVAKSPEAAGGIAQDILGLTPETAPQLYDERGQVNVSALYNLLLEGRKRNTPLSELLSPEQAYQGG